MITRLEPKEWLELNAKLQQKKNNVRTALKDKGVLKRGESNDFDRYKYFSEAQYKLLFTELFATHKLELKFTELAYDTFEGTAKQSNGRIPKIRFTLTDVETGFYEETDITGEGMDKGDKAGYKAYTGALKYFLADTFMVATGDDPEKDSPSETMNTKKARSTKSEPKLTRHELEDKFIALCDTKGKRVSDFCNKQGASELAEVTDDKLLKGIAWLEKEK